MYEAEGTVPGSGTTRCVRRVCIRADRRRKGQAVASSSPKAGPWPNKQATSPMAGLRPRCLAWRTGWAVRDSNGTRAIRKMLGLHLETEEPRMTRSTPEFRIGHLILVAGKRSVTAGHNKDAGIVAGFYIWPSDYSSTCPTQNPTRKMIATAETGGGAEGPKERGREGKQRKRTGGPQWLSGHAGSRTSRPKVIVAGAATVDQSRGVSRAAMERKKTPKPKTVITVLRLIPHHAITAFSVRRYAPVAIVVLRDKIAINPAENEGFWRSLCLSDKDEVPSSNLSAPTRKALRNNDLRKAFSMAIKRGKPLGLP